MEIEFLKKLNIEPAKLFKTIGIGLVGIVVVAFLVSLISSSMPGFGRGGGGVISPMMGGVSYDASYAESGKMYAPSYAVDGPQTLSVRNISPIVPPRPGTTLGNNAEDFEVTDYTATIETRDKEKACSALAALKPLKYVIFESANAYEYGCSYSFKVEHAHVAEVLATIKTLDPKDLSENTYTIKRQLDDFTSESTILRNKLKSIDDTMSGALRAYDQIISLATRTEDVESLAKIIDSKIQIIERLTQQRININEQLDRLARAKVEQMDRLDYTYFNVSVYENKFVDGQSLKDSWKQTIKNFVSTVNGAAQDATVNVVAFILTLVPYLIYLVILLLVTKYGWKLVKYIWQK